MKSNSMQGHRRRQKRGATTSMLLLGLTMILLLFGGLAVDVAHGFCVKRQLQAAADAGAVAGAYCLTSPFPKLDDKKKAQQWAREIISRNHSDGISLIHDEDNVSITVDVEVTPLKYPYTCHVIISKNMATTLGRLVGVNSIAITTDATGGAYLGLKKINAGQLLPMGISSRAGIGKTMLNLSPLAGGKQNAQWLNDWHGRDNPMIDVGATPANGSDNPGENLGYFSPGTIVAVPMIKSQTDDKSDDRPIPKSNQIIGTVGLQINKVISPTQIDGTILSGPIISGKPGMPILTTVSTKDTQFAYLNPCWRIMLVR
jgi:Flp pilus assembly protein TadG